MPGIVFLSGGQTEMGKLKAMIYKRPYISYAFIFDKVLQTTVYFHFDKLLNFQMQQKILTK